MNRSTKLKLIMPVLYAMMTLGFFVLTWPDAAHAHHYAGVGIALLSFVLWITARVQLGNAFSIGAKANYLVTSGLYRKLRHPVYYFSVLAIVGIGVYIWQLLVVVPIGLLIGLELYRVREEEKTLTDTFGSAYTRYKASTWF